MPRSLQPELLDSLDPAHPEAIGSRRDLRRLNVWMGHDRIIARALALTNGGTSSSRVVELGAGDGTLLLRVARRLGRQSHGAHAILVDRHPVVSTETLRAFGALNWHVECLATDVFEWFNSRPSYPAAVLLANLFLHHFSEPQLTALFCEASRQAALMVALEPRRATMPLLFSKWVGLAGCNRVTRHDAPVSVRAGFNGHELSRLWPADGGWQLDERPAGWFSHLFIARRLGLGSPATALGEPPRRENVCPLP